MKRNQAFAVFFAYIAISVLSLGILSAKTIKIISTNDMHAAIDKFPKFIGMVDSLRDVYPDLILLSAGDNRTGNPINDMHPTPSYPMVAFMNAAKFDLTVIGNHEFDGKPQALRDVINLSNFRHLCANMYAHDTLRLHVEPYKILERDGIKIGVLGLLQVNERGIPDCHPMNVQGIKFRDPMEVAKEYKWLRQHCDILVLLTHNGHDEDLKLAEAFPEADLIIGGHSHTAVHESKIENGVLVTQAGSKLKYLSETTIEYNNGKVTDKHSKLLEIASTNRESKEAAKLYQDFSQDKSLKRVLTKSNYDFANKEELGCMMADAQRAAVKADIAVQNSGGVRYSTKKKGNITVEDVYKLDPFQNELYVFNLTGQEVVELLKENATADDYGVPFVSGITYTITFGKIKQDVKSLEIKMSDGKPIDLNKTYKVALNSYVASISAILKDKKGENTGLTSSLETIKWLEKQKSVNYKHCKRVNLQVITE